MPPAMVGSASLWSAPTGRPSRSVADIDGGVRAPWSSFVRCHAGPAPLAQDPHLGAALIELDGHVGEVLHELIELFRLELAQVERHARLLNLHGGVAQRLRGDEARQSYAGPQQLQRD